MPKEISSDNILDVKPKKESEFVIEETPLPLSESELRPFHIDSTNRKISVVDAPVISTSSRKFLKLLPDFLLSGVLHVDPTVTTVAGNVGATTLNTYTIPLNTISRNNSVTEHAGNTFRIHAAGVYTTDDATANVGIALKIGSTTYHTITTTGATITNAPWCIDWVVIIATIGATGTAESYVSAKTNNVNKDSGGTAAITIDTTADQAISIVATWASGSAGDSISIRHFIVELLN